MSARWCWLFSATLHLMPLAASAAAGVQAPVTPVPGAVAREASVAGCTLLLAEHRSERELLRVGWPERSLRVSFVHSVLGTPVQDFYVWRDHAWVLVEERFEGQGYGLPHTAAAGERWAQDGPTTRLLLNRNVMPLVIRPLPSQDMRVQLDDGRQWRLADLSTQAIELQARGC
jgi:hypothetical protein